MSESNCSMCRLRKAQVRLSCFAQADLERQVATLTAMVTVLHPYSAPDDLEAALAVLQPEMIRLYEREEAGVI